MDLQDLWWICSETEWENFNNVIQKAVIAYKNSNNDDLYWLPEVRKPIITGKGKEEYIKDYKLSRYICYLIVQNANPKKQMVALGQSYFAFEKPTTSDTTRPSGKNVYGAMDTNGTMRFIYQNQVDPGYGCLAYSYDNQINCN